MKKFLAAVLFLCLTLSPAYTADTSCPTENNTKQTTVTLFCKQNKSDKIVKNKLFKIVLPKEIKNYQTKKTKNSISIYHKPSKKAGFGGFAFSIEACKNPSEYAGFPGYRKIGELTDKKNNLYDVVLVQPTDVQYDYTKGEDKEYLNLYRLGEKVEISGNKGSVYFKNQGMKGEKLYKDILKKHAVAIQQKWDSKMPEKENISYMYGLTKNVGYAYYDVNGDGIEELFIGEITDGDNKGIIYDMYTMVNRKPAHVVSGSDRNRYFVCNNSFICNEKSGGANESETRIYFLTENSTELFPQVAFKYDKNADKDNPWFISYNFEKNKWDKVSEKKYQERKKTFSRYKRFDYRPLAK